MTVGAPENPSRDDRPPGMRAESTLPESALAPTPASAALQWTVSVVSHGQAALCSRLLDDLARLAPPSLAKVIVTVNVPESEPRLGALPFAVQFVRNARPKGFGANHNQAFARSDTPYFAVLNPDLRMPQDPFPELRRRLADAAVGVVSPLVLEADGTVADHARRLLTPGVFLAFRAETYRALGGFDEHFHLYCEDADLCARAQLAGLRIEVAEAARVVHLAQRASRRRPKYLFWHLRSLAKFWRSPTYRNYRDLLASGPPDSPRARPEVARTSRRLR